MRFLCSKTVDDQAVAPGRFLTYHRGLQAKLRELGYHEDALCLQIIGEAHQAWVEPHLTVQERDRRIDRMAQLCFHCMARTWMDPYSRKAAEAASGGCHKELLIHVVAVERRSARRAAAASGLSRRASHRVHHFERF